MSCFDDGNYNDVESYPCFCGGQVYEDDNHKWVCSRCGSVNGGEPQ